jgi:hypothetical protein
VFCEYLWNLFIINHLAGCATLVVFVYNVGDWITIWHLNYWGHHRCILYTSFINDRLSINGGHSCRMIKSISTVGISSLITCIYFGVVTKSEAEIFPGYRTLSLVKSRSHECRSWSLGKVMRHLFLLLYLMDAANDSKWSIYRPKLYRRRETSIQLLYSAFFFQGASASNLHGWWFTPDADGRRQHNNWTIENGKQWKCPC